MKICSRCKEEKPKSCFSIRKDRKDGLNYYCRECVTKIYAPIKKKYRQNGGYQKEKESLLNSSLRFSAHKIRNLVRITIKNGGYSKNTKTCLILGAEFNVVRSHIQSLFKDGMSWENHGKWHIDHIVPVSSAKSEEELLLLNHYTNLRPLWAIDNLRKGTKTEYTLSH